MDRKLAVISLIAAAILALASGLPVEELPTDENHETENNRMMTLDRTNGEETYQNDEEVARTLEMANTYKSSNLFNVHTIPEDSDPSEETPDKTKRDIIGRDSR